jgi:hypothetical protein
MEHFQIHTPKIDGGGNEFLFRNARIWNQRGARPALAFGPDAAAGTKIGVYKQEVRLAFEIFCKFVKLKFIAALAAWFRAAAGGNKR